MTPRAAWRLVLPRPPVAALLVALVALTAPVHTLAAAEGEPAWPAPEAARIRPGVQVSRLITLGPVAPGGCTGAFLFASPDGATQYLSTAGHCTGEKGAEKVVAGFTTATVAYCSFATRAGACRSGSADPNDFGLLELRAQDRPLVHPAVLGWGGPTRLAACAEVDVGGTVHMYGNSSLKPDAEAAKRVSGLVVRKSDPWSLFVVFQAPVVPADSGSPVLTADGGALGIARGAQWDGTSAVTCLDAALAHAAAHGAPPVRLVTWRTP